MTEVIDEAEARRWDAVVRRDREATGFLYAVKTTGIYCRPYCPSRRPNRANVVFFATGLEAERAGFRACKRCRPASAAPVPPAHEAIVRACAMIEEADEPPSLGEMAGAVGLSPHHFHRLFRETVGVSPKGYASSVRARRLREGLARGGTVTGAIYGAGFGSSGRCYEQVGATLGMTPMQSKRGAEGLVILVAVAECRLGWVLVAATGRGLCMVEFDDSPENLRDRLASRFPGAEFRDDAPDFSGLVAEVISLIESPGRGTNLPLDIQGTAFQRRVWEALRAIPAGTTASYAEVARRIGRPAAVRAVAGACAANRLAVVIPCHRVVPSGGGPGGYRWGVERKQELLRRESGTAKPSEEES